MTRRAGFIRVPITQHEAREVAVSLLWLSSIVKPSAPSLLCGDDTPTSAASLRLLVRAMIKASRYQRENIELRREELEAAQLAYEVAAIHKLFVPKNVTDFLQRCRVLMAGKGRPRLSRKQVQMWIKEQNGDIRELRRLRKRERINQWCDDISAKGETLLTATVPPP